MQDGQRSINDGPEPETAKPGKVEDGKPFHGKTEGEPDKNDAAIKDADKNNSNKQQQAKNGSNSANPNGPPKSDGVASGHNNIGGGASSADDNITDRGAHEIPAMEESAADLRYAEQTTDLVLDAFKKQLKTNSVDQKFLDDLGWTCDDLQTFVDRWEKIRTEAAQSGPAGDAAKKVLQERLRSLGLRPQQATNLGNSQGDDKERNLRQSRRTVAPAEYRELFKAYQKGTAGGK